MKKTLLMIGLGAAGYYFLDSKKGKKRRAHFTHNVKSALEQAECYCSDLAERSKPLVGELKKQGKPVFHKLIHEGQKVATEFGRAVRDSAGNAHFAWQPSARLSGAAAGALALYGAGRSGFSGALLRTLSLGFFTKALMASR